MKILIVMPAGELRGGAEQMLLDLLEQGRGEGTEWRVVLLEEGGMTERIRALDVPVDVVPAGRLREPGRFWAVLRRIEQFAREGRFDLIFGWMGKAHLYGGLAARRAGIDAVWYQVGMPSPKSLLDRIITRIPAKGILACSKAGAEGQARVKPVRLMRVVYPGVPLDRFDPATLPIPKTAREQLGLPLTGPLVGIVGRFQRWKGLHVFVEAMARVREHHPEAHGVIVGGRHDLEPDYPAFVEERIRTLGLQESITLAGLQANVPLWMQAMDIFVHASDNEPFGIVIIEAMALGKPIIAGNAGGPTEILTEGVDGLLTPYGDAEALAHAIRRYLEDPIFAQSVGEAGWARAQTFSTAAYAQNIIEAVKALRASRES